MDSPTGRVVAVGNTQAPLHALVEVDAALNCRRCAEGKGCGAGVFGRTTTGRRVDALIAAGLSVEEGDEVRIELAPASVLRASLLVYGAPLAGAVLAASIAYVARLGDVFAAASAIIGIAAGLMVARTQLRKASCLRQFTPTVVERLSASNAPLRPDAETSGL